MFPFLLSNNKFVYQLISFYICSMKKLILIITFCLLWVINYAQTFNGINVGTTYNVTHKVLIKSGFYKTDSTNNKVNYIGKVVGEDCKITIVCTPISNVVWKIIVYANTNYSWYSAKSSYNRYKEILSNKYILSNEYMFFSSPYSEGDGYELSALYKDKCRFKSFFKDSLDNNISLELISFKYEVVNTVIQYENKIAADLNKKEKVEIANKTF